MVKQTLVLNAKPAKHAKRKRLCGLCALCVPFALVITTSTMLAAPPVRTMYTEALARERTVRVALAAADAAPTLLPDVRAVIGAYEATVKAYPASGYSDNALWQAGCLALDAFARFGQPQDKDTGLRLLRKLAATYPTSKLVKLVPEQLARAIGEEDPAARPQGRPLQSGMSRSTAAPSNVGPGLQNAGAGLQAGPSAATRLATIKDIRRVVLPDAVRITIELDAEVPFHDERIADPARVFVDLPGTRAVPALVDRTIRFDSDADVVRQVRIGRHPNNTTRVVLDAAGVTSYSVYPLYNPYRLVIDCIRATAVAAVTAPPMPRPLTPAAVKPDVAPALLPGRRLTAEWLRRPPSMSPRATARLAAASAAGESPAPVARNSVESVTADEGATTPKTADLVLTAPRAPVTPPAKNVTGGFSIARQLGLGVSRIVIDAGHGGHDPGAKGKGITEAELVLDVALRLEKLLQKVPGIEVILTRRTDEFIALPERTAIANREGADLFLSIHANASASPQARGIETYFLNFANNITAAAVAARENAASSQAMGALPDFVKAIALNNKLDESRDLATQVQRAMFDRLKTTNRTLKDLGVKQAPFVVLIGAAMPSVLAEISFVTNPQEAKLLKGNVYRQRIAEALFNAIRKYQTSLKNTTTIALQ
jgi:N-acetylmuramoyl-L-alanine amidase